MQRYYYLRVPDILQSSTRALRDRIYLRQNESGPHPESAFVSGLQIRTSHPDDFDGVPKFSWDFLFQVTFVVKFPRRFHHFVQRYEPNCGKNALVLQCWRILQKIPGSGSGSESGWLPKFNQFFLVHRCICGKFFYGDLFSSFPVKLLTDKQKNRQTDIQTDKQTKEGIA